MQCELVEVLGCSCGVGMMTQDPLPRQSPENGLRQTADGVQKQWYRTDVDHSSWKAVMTPDFWEAYPGLASYDGWGWFVRTFSLEAVSSPLSIHFAGVDDDAEVWINGKSVGDHAGYSDPFALDVTSAVKPGVNTIAVLVKDYSGGGGIYRPVTLIETARLEELLRSPLSCCPPARAPAGSGTERSTQSISAHSRRKGRLPVCRSVPELKQLRITTSG
jgi:hypothetical protein